MIIVDVEKQSAWSIKSGENLVWISPRTCVICWVEVDIGVAFGVPVCSNFHAVLGRQFGRALELDPTVAINADAPPPTISA